MIHATWWRPVRVGSTHILVGKSWSVPVAWCQRCARCICSTHTILFEATISSPSRQSAVAKYGTHGTHAYHVPRLRCKYLATRTRETHQVARPRCKHPTVSTSLHAPRLLATLAYLSTRATQHRKLTYQ